MSLQAPVEEDNSLLKNNPDLENHPNSQKLEESTMRCLIYSQQVQKKDEEPVSKPSTTKK